MLNTISLDTREVEIPAEQDGPTIHYILDEEIIWAVNTALATQRPLLVTGEPGTGKSQLARAVAHNLERFYRCEVISARTEAESLLWEYDAVGRLAQAQVLNNSDKKDKNRLIDEKNFVKPGCLWLSLNYTTAEKQLAVYEDRDAVIEKKANRATVLLLDEIDKADADVPNSLLEVLDKHTFTVPYLNETMQADAEVDKPLIIITSNGERELPSAFLRRCIVLQMKVGEPLEKWLVARAKAHFGKHDRIVTPAIMTSAATLLAIDRKASLGELSKPGLAEYLDLLYALSKLTHSEEEAASALEKIRPFTLRKHIRRG